MTDDVVTDAATPAPADRPDPQTDAEALASRAGEMFDAPAAKARAEARRLRERLRDVEAERDELAAAIERADADLTAADERVNAAEDTAAAIILRRVEEYAESWGLRDGADMWRHGLDVDDARDPDTGGISPTRVGDMVRGLAEERPHLLAPGAPVRRQVNPELTRAQRLMYGVEPAPDASPEEWAEYRYAKRLRPGFTGSGPVEIGHTPTPYPAPDLGHLISGRATKPPEFW